jgi:serine/threonine-protein kinase
MSPEQACGDLDRLGPRSDVNALGATLYCLLTGRPPLEGEDVGELLRKVQAGDFRTPREIDPALDRALESVCLRAMAHRPADRYASAKALAEDVERWMADEPVSAWREPLARRARRWARRNRTAVTAAAAALLAGVIGLSAVLTVQMRAKADISRALRRETNANAALAVANEELGRSQAAVQARYELAAEAIKTFHTGVLGDFLLKEEALKEIRDQLLKSAADFYVKLGALLGRETDPASRRSLAAANFELAELTGKVGRAEEALAAHRAVLAARESLAAEPGADAGAMVELGRSLTAVAGLRGATGKTDDAVAAYRRSEASLAGPAGSDAAALAALAACRSRLGQLLSDTDRTDEALTAYRRARADQESLAAAAGASDEARRDLADTVDRIGFVLSRTGQPAKAEAELRMALVLRRRLADDHPAVTDFRDALASSHFNLGILLQQTGRQAEAEAELRTALALWRKLADDHPAVTGFRRSLGRTHQNLGLLLRERGRPAEAEAELRSTTAIYQKLADDHPAITRFREGLGFNHGNLGMLLMETGRLAEAEPEFRMAVAIFSELVDNHPTLTQFRFGLAAFHHDLGLLLVDTGRPAEAEAEFRTALAIIQKLADDHPKVPDYRIFAANAGGNGLSIALRRLGRPAEARALCDQAIAAVESLVADHPETPFYRLCVAENYLHRSLARRAASDHVGAVADARRAVAHFDALASPSGESWFLSACAHAVLAGLADQAGSGVSAAEAASDAESAVVLLHKAVAMGYRYLASYRKHDALDPLRDREDFRLLMMDLAFPAEPFAAAR